MNGYFYILIQSDEHDKITKPHFFFYFGGGETKNLFKMITLLQNYLVNNFDYKLNKDSSTFTKKDYL